MPTLSHDILIIGAGLAGQRAAIEARKQNMDVGMVSKVHPVRAPSTAATSGINASLGKEDDWKTHTKDTIFASDFLADHDAVELLCKDAPSRIRELESWGVVFSRTNKGEIAQRLLGGNSVPRTCYAGDRIGHTLVHTLYDQLSRTHPTIYPDYYALSLMIEKNRCHGAVLWDVEKGKVVTAKAGATLLATGGFAQLFARSASTLNTTGDGHALVYRAGLPLEDMEFVQFHPTGLDGNEKGFLIGETFLNQGAHLLNAKGERFMKKYAPQKMESAPHDIVARAIATEISLGRGCGEKKDCIHLNTQHLAEKTLHEHVPRTLNVLKNNFVLDARTQNIPVSPIAQYSLGGIPTDIHTRVTRDAQNTPLEGLYSAGEAACVSVHGATRLSGNSLLETVVFGRIAGQKMAEYVRQSDAPQQADYSANKESARLRVEKLLSNTQGSKSHTVKEKLQRTMTTACGVFRNHSTLTQGLHSWKKLHEESKKIHVDDKSPIFNTDLLSALECQNLVTIAQPILASAHARKETRGCHTRTDYSQRDDQKWLKHSLAFHHGESAHLRYKPIVIKGYSPERRHY